MLHKKDHKYAESATHETIEEHNIQNIIHFLILHKRLWLENAPASKREIKHETIGEHNIQNMIHFQYYGEGLW